MRAALLVALPAALQLGGGGVADAGGPEPPAGASVAAEVCQQCHWDEFAGYRDSAHALSGDSRTPAATRQCESCHGPGAAHVEGGGGRGVGALLAFVAGEAAEARNAPCLECHGGGKTALWPGSAHQDRGMACADCHRVHGGHPRLLAQPSEPQLCTGCHAPVRSALMKSSHHPVREGKLACTSCHNPHGAPAERLVAAATVNDKCYECHAETRGPFVFEHPPVRESCLNCHDPHGSPHDALLVAKRPLLCQRCHQNAGHSSALFARAAEDAGLSVYQLRSPFLFYRSCSNCHVQVHGTNHPSGRFWHR